MTITAIEKVLYTGKTHTTGGRDGAAQSSDGRLDIKLSSPGTSGGGTNPEQLFAAGWSACFMGAMGLAAGQLKIALPADRAIDAEVDLGTGEGGYLLQARLNVSLPGLDRGPGAAADRRRPPDLPLFQAQPWQYRRENHVGLSRDAQGPVRHAGQGDPEKAFPMENIDHILIVDDDREIRELVSTYLVKNGLRATVAADGRQMRTFLEANAVDLIILDVMMPGDDGLVLCRELRSGKNKATPILMLTARSDETDRIIGLEMGADDYLVKPFAARELLARIKAVLRRTRMLPPNLRVTEVGHILSFGKWQLDTVGRHLIDQDGIAIALSGAEYRLLRAFVDHPQRVLNRDQLLSLTQGREAELFDRSIDLLVSRLRQRLADDAREPAYIKTVRSEGYVFSMPVEISEARK